MQINYKGNSCTVLCLFRFRLLASALMSLYRVHTARDLKLFVLFRTETSCHRGNRRVNRANLNAAYEKPGKPVMQ